MPALSNRLLGAFHRLAAKSRIVVRLAIKFRNQGDAILRARFKDSIDMEQNGELWMIERIAPQASFFIDVGANVGDWTTEFLKRMKPGGRGLALEPSPTAAHRIAVKLSKNGWGNSVEILQIAASNATGKQSFHMEPSAGQCSSLVRGHSSSDSKLIDVEVSTIDSEMTRREINHVDYLKIDTEGYDLNVIKGALSSLKKNKIGVVQFEYNHPWIMAGSTLDEALRILKSCGYAAFLLKGDGLYEFDYRLYGEYYGYSNFVALSPRYCPEFSRFVRGQI